LARAVLRYCPVRRGSGFDGVQVFSATIGAKRLQLGDRIAEWVASHPAAEIADIIVAQSSDDEFHCVSIVVFYRGAGTGT
jgi:hypothetical protein